jgi:hypothetical protein
VDALVEYLDDIEQNVLDLNSDIVDLIDDLTSVNTANALDDAITALDAISQALNNTNDLALSSDLESLQGDFSDEIEKYDSQRSQFFKAALGILCALILFEGFIAIYHAKGPDTCNPRSNMCCKIFTTILSLVMLLIVLVLWILAGFMVGVTTVTSDFCIQADTNLLEATGLDTEDLTNFIVRCDENATLRECNPFASDINDLTTNLDDLITDWNGYFSTCDAAFGTSTCTGINTTVFSLKSNVDNFISDLLGCKGPNRLYQSVILLVCDNAAESFGSTTDLLLAFAVIFAMTEIFARLMADAWREDEEDDNYAGSKVI